MKQLLTTPRLLLAAPGSGNGKTTVACGLLWALQRRFDRVKSFKCGPDYIDPMFHSKLLSSDCRNLDLFLSGEEGVRFLLGRSATDCEFALIEGVMGLYDGLGVDSQTASTNHLALVTETPTVLVVRPGGMSLSLKALLKGFLEFSDNRLKGVIFNQCSKGMYPTYSRMAQELGLIPCGFLPPIPQGKLGSRHLGLITAQEVENLEEKLQGIGRAAEENLEMDVLCRLAFQAPPLEYQNLWESEPYRKPVRIGLARDRAFCFIYQDNLELLELLGASIVPFSPIEDTALPEGLDGLWLPGGYPEEWAPCLSQNCSMLESVKRSVAGGMPTIAECGGFLYLLSSLSNREGRRFSMAGALEGESHMTSKLVRFGYQTLRAKHDNLLCSAGQLLRAHEFHYSDSDCNGEDIQAEKRGRSWNCIHASPTLWAGYPHLHLGAFPQAAGRFLDACAAFQSIRN